MDLDLKGKRAFVSGSSSGIGKAIAIELAAEGCIVVVHGRDKVRAEATAQEIRARGGTAFVVLGDLTSDSDAARIVAETCDYVGSIDVLVNNSGGSAPNAKHEWSEVSIQQWIDTFQKNFLSMIRLCQALIEPMKQQRWGRVVNISSLASVEVFGQLFDYSAVKAALNKFSADTSKIVGPYGITVNTIIPGIIKTPPMQNGMDRTAREQGWGDDPTEVERRYAAMWSSSSVPRLGAPEEIAAAVAFLASPRAGYINGVALRIDGGSAHFV
jgi:NAD(P)-dependent dehydrogenase (short-subunit alcohol dehydrogenase family)